VVSVGVAVASATETDASQLIQAEDEALYRVKRNEKNRVIVS